MRSALTTTLTVALVAACAPIVDVGATTARGAIVNGAAAVDDDEPSAVAILELRRHAGSTTASAQIALCSGVLIEPDVVLTAAHCVVDLQSDVAAETTTDVLSFGVTTALDVHDGTVPADVIDVATMVAHPDFRVLAYGATQHDVALLFLATPSTRPTATLLQPSEASFVAFDTSLTAVGWGVNDDANDFAVKKIAFTRIAVATETFVGWWPGASLPQHCGGDSGGPAFLRVRTPSGVVERLVSVVAAGAGAGSHACIEGWDTRVDAQRAFIDDTLAAQHKPPLATPAALLAPHTAPPVPAALATPLRAIADYCDASFACGAFDDVEECNLLEALFFMPFVRTGCDQDAADAAYFDCYGRQDCDASINCDAEDSAVARLASTCTDALAMPSTDGTEPGDVVHPAGKKPKPPSCAAVPGGPLLIALGLIRRRGRRSSR